MHDVKFLSPFLNSVFSKEKKLIGIYGLELIP